MTLTPYDTGTRLQPMPWRTQPANLPDPEEADRYGRVDFDDDEGATLVTAYVEKTDSGYVMHIINKPDGLTIRCAEDA